jgi:hypothetical protein
MQELDPLGMAQGPDEGETASALRATFRAAFFHVDPGHPPGAAALQREATTLLDLRRQASRLLLATGAANLAEIFDDDPEMLAVLADSW